MALNPATPVSAIVHVLDLVELVLVMTVNPGFGGQAYLATMEPKIAEVRALLDADRQRRAGATSRSTAASARPRSRRRRPPAPTFVAGSALFGDPAGLGAAVGELRELATAALRVMPMT